jgi:hypothetical protein
LNYLNIFIFSYALHLYTAENGCENLRKNVEEALQKNVPIMVTEYGLSHGTGGGGINTHEMDKW